jgi:glycine/D-amino acid oxidase-like deaminating enzyme
VDGRILWGWVDGTIPARLRPEARYDQLPEVFSHMAGDLLRTFPQLAGVRFTHKWGGALDVSSRRAPFFTRGLGGRAIAANGFTTGVAGSRFAAEVMLDLLEGASTDRTRLALVQDRPRTRLYPPAPVMRVAAPLTLRSMASRGETGRTDLWLRMLGRLGYEI